MAILDIIILVLMIPAIIRGISKGFIEQVSALAALLVSAYLAYLFADKVGDWLGQYITVNPSVLYIIGFVVIVILTVMVLNLLGKLLTKLVEKLSLGFLNKILGTLLAIFNTAIIIGLILALFSDINTRIFHLSTDFMEESFLYEWIKALTDWIFPFLKDLFDTLKESAASI